MLLNDFLLVFIPIFVSIDAFGLIPIFISLTEGIDKKRRLKLSITAICTALIVALAFIFLGKAILTFLGISVEDFRIAGGIILLTLSINDMLSSSENKLENSGETIGVVPLGIPLLVGPALMATLLISVDKFGYPLTIIALISNLLLVLVTFILSGFLMKMLGNAGSKGLAKVANLLLAAYAVMMIREGIMNLIRN